MKTKITKKKWLVAIACCCMFGNVSAQEDPAYFTQDFEDGTTYPATVSATESTFNKPYGEWKYLNVSTSDNVKYLRTGMGKADLRMPKSKGAYAITPLLDRGAKTVSFYEGRGDREISVYISTDGGTTWTKKTTVNTDATTYVNTVTIDSVQVNRIKLSNTGAKDADVDNISVTILATGTKATITTGDATNITKTSADVSGVLTSKGDKEMVEYGICWSYNATPTVADTKVAASAETFTVSLTGLNAGKTIYYCGYAISGAGTSYGEVKNFTTAAPALLVLKTKAAVLDNRSYDKTTMSGATGGTITNNGDGEPSEAGVVYGTSANPTTADSKATAASVGDDFDFNVKMIKLLPNTTYYYRAYAINAAGTAYGDELSVKTGDLKIIEGGAKNIIYCSPEGKDDTGDGSEATPFYTLQKAADIVQPGDTIYMMAGTYQYSARQNLDTCGTAEKPIALYAKGGRAILDFTSMPYHAHSDNPEQGVRLTGSYWHFYGLDITKASDNGLLIERNKPVGGSVADIVKATNQGHDNIIEQCNFYKNGDTGLQIKNLGSFNKIINCDSYLNCDEGQGDADGFAPKISVGDGNYFYGCRAYLNSDDGWDVFFKKDGGFSDNVSIIMENCISYKNGFLNETTVAEKGNGNGFKMGSDQGAMNVFLSRCVSVCNKSKGFDQNHNAGDIIMNNCTGMTLKSISDKAYSYRIYEAIASGHKVALTNCIAINDNATTDKVDKTTGKPKAGEEGKYGIYGRFQVDDIANLTKTTCEFRSAAPALFENVENHADLMAARDAKGNLSEITFAHIKAGSDLLIDKGTKIDAGTYRGLSVNGISYAGEAPDLGAYETGVVTGIQVVNSQASDKSLGLVQTESGIVLVSVNGASTAEGYQAQLFNSNGQMIGQHSFNGSTTAIYLPQSAKGICLLRVVGKNYNQTIKVVLK
jgi:hypothetical protein